MTQQITDTIMMVRPSAFRLNDETAVNNYFQQAGSLSSNEAQERALSEFDNFVGTLRSAGIQVLVFQDKAENGTPDSIFPNNWNSFHDDGRIYLYPMFAPNRRKERRQDILDALIDKYRVSKVDSFIDWESKGKFLEGTGSLILDRPNKIAYAAIGDRTHLAVLEDFSTRTGYEVVSFTSNQSVHGERKPIYHTNVMMCVGENFVVICLDSIDDRSEREIVVQKLQSSGKEVIDITEEQKDKFAGNMLQVQNSSGDRFVVMSQQAYQCLSSEQIESLSKHGQLLYSPINTIEQLGGGGVRCMMAEIFLPKKN